MNVGNGVCHSTKKSITYQGYLGPAMFFLLLWRPGGKAPRTLPEGKGNQFVLAREKTRAISEGRKLCFNILVGFKCEVLLSFKVLTLAGKLLGWKCN